MNSIENLPASRLETFLEIILKLTYVSSQIVDSTEKCHKKIKAKLFEDTKFSYLCLGIRKTLSFGEFDES